VVGRGHNLR